MPSFAGFGAFAKLLTTGPDKDCLNGHQADGYLDQNEMERLGNNSQRNDQRGSAGQRMDGPQQNHEGAGQSEGQGGRITRRPFTPSVMADPACTRPSSQSAA
jgi:hypothetical protein